MKRIPGTEMPNDLRGWTRFVVALALALVAMWLWSEYVADWLWDDVFGLGSD